MKRKFVVTGLCLLVLLSAGWGLLTAMQQQKKIKTTTAPALRVEPAIESDTTGKTVAAAKAFLATLDDAGRAKVSFAFNSDQKSKWSNFPGRHLSTQRIALGRPERRAARSRIETAGDRVERARAAKS
jgi:hypothetical protein